MKGGRKSEKADKDVNDGQLTRTPLAFLGRQAKVV